MRTGRYPSKKWRPRGAGATWSGQERKASALIGASRTCNDNRERDERSSCHRVSSALQMPPAKAAARAVGGPERDKASQGLAESKSNRTGLRREPLDYCMPIQHNAACWWMLSRCEFVASRGLGLRFNRPPLYAACCSSTSRDQVGTGASATRHCWPAWLFQAASIGHCRRWMKLE